MTGVYKLTKTHVCIDWQQHTGVSIDNNTCGYYFTVTQVFIYVHVYISLKYILNNNIITNSFHMINNNMQVNISNYYQKWK